jgi:para-nitrobenzyl esterase
MVWFHGGGFAYGSGHWPVYDGANLAAKGDVIVVTVNHRLNVFGFLDLTELDAEKYAGSGNVGMLDLVLALQWVRDNAAAFGGDPDNVTIMGESGGGAKVSTLLAMPSAAGLFHKAIVQSGPGLTGIPQTTAQENTRKILAKLGISRENLTQLTTLTADRILDATIAAAADAGPDFMSLRLGPVVDGKVLPRDPFMPEAPDQSKDIPLMIGWNKDEFSLFNAGAPWFGSLTEEQLAARSQAVAGEKSGALLDAYRELYPDYSPTYLFNMLFGDMRMFQGSVMLADRKAAQRGAPVYMYYLVWETPVGGGVFKSPHTLDMPFMFNNVDKSVAITGDSPEARQLENQMSSAWIAFARSGNPDNAQLPHWPAYSSGERSTMVFDVTPRVENDPKSKIRQLLIGQTEQ